MFEIGHYLMQLAGFGGLEWIIVIAIIIALFFGVKKIPELARSFGRASGEFEKAKIEMRKEIDKVKTGTDSESVTSERERLVSVAGKLGIEHTDKTNEELRRAIEESLNKNK
jgi:sec-independent protein translocase protein TatA